MTLLSLSTQGLSIHASEIDSLSFDVSFSGRRIWTVEVSQIPADVPTVVPWPEPLLPFLSGHTAATVQDSASAEVLWEGDVVFSADPQHTEVADPQGTPLAINKWGRLAPDLAGLSPDVLAGLLADTQAVVALLESLGKRPFAVGGTLLGAVRDGSLLPHDDDVDIAFLSAHTKPLNVAVETLKLARDLRAAGYELVEHSAAHLQLIFRDASQTPIYHIDIFAAFFTTDGNINQPFHVRGPFRTDQMLPFQTVELNGIRLPAPADTDAWLELNYDENWRTPIPGYKLVTPEDTVRRFDTWFGGFNFQREFWEEWFEVEDHPELRWETGARWLEQQNLDAPLIIDLGSGDGLHTSALAAQHPTQQVRGADFSDRALRRATARIEETENNLEFVQMNLSMFSALQVPKLGDHDAAFDLVANHLFEQVGHRARANALRLARMALRSGGSAYITSYAHFADDVSNEDPTTWHLEQSTLQSEAALLGLQVEFTELIPAPGEASRLPYGATFSLHMTPDATETAVPATAKDNHRHMLSRFFRFLTRRPSQREQELEAELNELKFELDELRMNNLRVAEVVDALESALTPGQALPKE